MNYFSECERRVAVEPSWQGNLLSFSRRHLEDVYDSNDWLGCDSKLLDFDFHYRGAIEDAIDCLQADFANVQYIYMFK